MSSILALMLSASWRAPVVNRDVEPFTVVGGVPAKPIAKIDPARFRPERLS